MTRWVSHRATFVPCRLLRGMERPNAFSRAFILSPLQFRNFAGAYETRYVSFRSPYPEFLGAVKQAGLLDLLPRRDLTAPDFADFLGGQDVAVGTDVDIHIILLSGSFSFSL